MPAEDWDQISDHAKELITRMLDGNPATRITLEEVRLTHQQNRSCYHVVTHTYTVYHFFFIF